MSKRDRKQKNRHKSSLYSNEQILREKHKARVLRNSSWWRKKTASGICYYCGRKFQPDELTMDHKIPLSRGGVSEKFNIVPACKECNTKKKYLLPAEWDEYLDMIKSQKV